MYKLSALTKLVFQFTAEYNSIKNLEVLLSEKKDVFE